MTEPNGFGVTVRTVVALQIRQNGGKMRYRAIFVSLIVVGQMGAGGPVLAQDIAGINPSTRPEGAPVVSEMKKDADWYARALAGVVAPYPASLQFLEDQGAWFNPFTRPGMPGPYDIRGWHSTQ